MKIRKVKEIMIPLAEYATVNEDDTLKKAIETLHHSQQKPSSQSYKHRAVLVFDRNGKVSGKVGPLDVLRSLEPKYCQLGHSDQFSKMGLSRFGLSNEFLHSIAEHYCLWDESFETLVRKAGALKVKDIMYSPYEGEFVSEDATIAEAIHQLILGHHQSLLVLQKDQVIGILRLADIFKLICDQMVDA